MTFSITYVCPFIKQYPFFSPITFIFDKNEEGPFFFLPITGFPITNQLTYYQEIDIFDKILFFRKNYLMVLLKKKLD